MKLLLSRVSTAETEAQDGPVVIQIKQMNLQVTRAKYLKDHGI